MAYWLLKTEPGTFSYSDLERLSRDRWNGVRNFVALRYMRDMLPGDLAFIYHTGKEKAIVGIAEIVSAPYPDSTEDDSRFIVVDVEPRRRLSRPVTLKEVKSKQEFSEWQLVTQSRLSVMPVPVDYWQKLLSLAGD